VARAAAFVGEGVSAAVLVPPLSKSDAQRALVLADLVGVPFSAVLPQAEDLPRDVRVLRHGLEVLRTGGEVDCHDGGAPFRFLVTQAALAVGRTTRLTGTARLGERPHQPLLNALKAALGEQVIETGAPWPILGRAPASLEGVEGFEVTGVESSQFASSLLLGAARVAFSTQRPCQVRVQGELASEGYLALTRIWLERAGFSVVGPAARMLVRHQGPAKPLEVPGDWSSLTYLLLLAWRSSAAVERVDFSAAHPDAAMVAHLESVGLVLHRDALVRVTGVATKGLRVDVRACPDAIPALAALALRLPTPSVFEHTAILRHKESDRLEAVRALVAAAGGSSTLEGERLTIEPAAVVRDFDFDAGDDHRLAMAAAVVAHLGGVRLRLRGRDAVGKSFPGFWVEAAKVGLVVD
jgi:3-phosphoshikimate 1-carboxyvinyltransferase